MDFLLKNKGTDIINDYGAPPEYKTLGGFLFS